MLETIEFFERQLPKNKNARKEYFQETTKEEREILKLKQIKNVRSK